MNRRLYTEFIDPLGIEAILANRPIPLDKGEGAVRPTAVRCRRSYTEDNGKVCYARDKARCH